jgi:ATP synthase protein I
MTAIFQGCVSQNLAKRKKCGWPTMSDKGQNSDNRDAELKARLDKLSGAIKTERDHIAEVRNTAAAKQPIAGLGSALGMGMRVSTELVAGVLVGGFIGWWLDHSLNSSPFGLLIMLMVGMVAGFWNVYRMSMRPARTREHTDKDKS